MFNLERRVPRGKKDAPLTKLGEIVYRAGLCVFAAVLATSLIAQLYIITLVIIHLITGVLDGTHHM